MFARRLWRKDQRFKQSMKPRKMRLLIAGVLACAAVVAVAVYAYYRPDSLLGHLYINWIYDPDLAELENVATHLDRVNGGYVSDALQRRLIADLESAKLGTRQRKNIIGFFAERSLSTRAGWLVYERGSPFISAVVASGREADEYWRKRGYLILATGILWGREPYKPMLDSDASEDVAALDEYLEQVGDGIPAPLIEP